MDEEYVSIVAPLQISIKFKKYHQNFGIGFGCKSDVHSSHVGSPAPTAPSAPAAPQPLQLGDRPACCATAPNCYRRENALAVQISGNGEFYIENAGSIRW